MDAAGKELPPPTATCKGTELSAACGGVVHLISPNVTETITQGTFSMATLVFPGEGSNPFPVIVTVRPP